MSEPWWKTAVVYQIYPRSFADSTASGVGDVNGITERLEYLEWLGVDALWLSPFYPSPMHDFGYDVADYCDVHPMFGTLTDFDRLLADAHARNIRVLIDWVPAHTSIEHPWFRESRSSRTNPKRDWYIWRDLGPDGQPPNNWTAAFVNRSAWTLDGATGQMYLHSFLPEQPDLNWRNPEVIAAMHDVLRFWMDRGVDGFRADVIHNIGKHPDLPDIAEHLHRFPHVGFNDEPYTHELLRDIRRLLDSYPGDRAMVGEAFLLSTKSIASYYGKNDELHLSFNFPPLFAPWKARDWQRHIEKTVAVFGPIGAWPTWVLSNHDTPRHRTRYGGSEECARAAAVLLLTLQGTPFMYMGEELGLENATVPKDRVVDPGGRDGCRAPLPWTKTHPYGWSADTWLPFPPNPDTQNVEAQKADATSILHLYRRLLHARKTSKALMEGDIELLPVPEKVIAYQRTAGEEQRVVVINFSQEQQRVDLPTSRRIEIASDGRCEGEIFSGDLHPRTALLLQ